MVRKFVSATVSAALCLLPVTPALAQEYRSGLDAPRGATATLNLRVPIGAAPSREAAQPSYGFTLGYGQTLGAPGYDGRTVTRDVRIADLRFSGGELRNARVASLDLANLDRDRRFNDLTGPNSTLWIIGGLVVAGVVICLAADCFDGDDDELSDN